MSFIFHFERLAVNDLDKFPPPNGQRSPAAAHDRTAAVWCNAC
jgi:hypothetical protein